MLEKLRTAKNNTAKLAFGFAIISTLGMYATVTGTKYDSVDFCFIPEVIKNPENEKQFCKSGLQIYRTLPKFLLRKDQAMPNPEYIQGVDRFAIPAKGRVIKNYNYASNPNFLIYGFISSILATTAYSLFNRSHQKYLELFPKLFNEHKLNILESELIYKQSKETKIFKTQLETEYINDQMSNEFQQMKFMDMDQEAIQEYQEKLQDQKAKQDLIAEKTFELEISEIIKAITDNALETAKKEKELQKLKTVFDKTKLSEDDKKNKIIELLENHENGWLLKILEYRKPLWIIGGQGCGKSTLASSIILLRWFLYSYDLEMIIDAHAHVNRLESWKHLIEIFPGVDVVGDNNDYLAISKAFKTCINRWAAKMPRFKSGEIDKSQMLVDEFTNLSDKDLCKEEAANFTKHSLSDPRKAGEFVICLAHFNTLTATGNKGGTSKAINTQTIQIHRRTANGETPLSNVIVSGLPDDNGDYAEINGNIPDWLRPEKIVKYFETGEF